MCNIVKCTSEYKKISVTNLELSLVISLSEKKQMILSKRNSIFISNFEKISVFTIIIQLDE